MPPRRPQRKKPGFKSDTTGYGWHISSSEKSPMGTTDLRGGVVSPLRVYGMHMRLCKCDGHTGLRGTSG